MFARLLGWCTVYTFWGFLPSNGIPPGAKFTLRSPILAALLHVTQAVGVSNTLRRGIFTDGAVIPFDIGWSECVVFHEKKTEDAQQQ